MAAALLCGGIGLPSSSNSHTIIRPPPLFSSKVCPYFWIRAARSVAIVGCFCIAQLTERTNSTARCSGGPLKRALRESCAWQSVGVHPSKFGL